MSVLRDIIIHRYLFDAIIFVLWIISEIMAFESCDVSSASIEQVTGRMFMTTMTGAIVELGWIVLYRDSFGMTMIESLIWNVPTRSKTLLGRIVLSIPTLFNRSFDDRDESMIESMSNRSTINPMEPPRRAAIARPLWYIPQMFLTMIAAEFMVPSLLISTWINRFFGDRNESMIDRSMHDSMESSRCAAIDRLLWEIPQMILVVIVCELVVFLSAYTIDWWKSRQAQRRPHGD